jgi:hypothetical protein
MFAEKEFELHECDIQLKGCRVIEVSSFYDGSYNGQRIRNGQGTDGILHSFRVIPRKAIPLMEQFSNRKVTDIYEEDDNNQRGNRTPKTSSII